MRKYSSTIPPLELGLTLTAGSDTATLESGSALPVIASPDTLTLVLSPDTENEEIVTVIEHLSGSDVIKIVRGQESTTDRTHASGSAVKHMVTARDLQEPHVHINATDFSTNGSVSLHGIGSGEGSVVGTSKAQTLTNKTIDSTNNTITIAQSRVTGLVDALDAKASKDNTVLSGNVTLPATTTIGDVSSTELGYVNGVTSAIQTQLDGKQPLDSDLTAIAGLSANGLITRISEGYAIARTILGGTGISVSNGNGGTGNPTISLSGTLPTRVATGTKNISVSSAATGSDSVSISGFTSAPVVTAVGDTGLYNVAVTSVSSTEINFSVRHIENTSATTTVVVRWIAVQM
jgi:hypothetical protein